MAGISNHRTFFGERIKGVAGDEPGRFDIVLFEEFEEATGANCARKDTL